MAKIVIDISESSILWKLLQVSIVSKVSYTYNNRINFQEFFSFELYWKRFYIRNFIARERKEGKEFESSSHVWNRNDCFRNSGRYRR